jgi:hypothetical protein
MAEILASMKKHLDELRSAVRGLTPTQHAGVAIVGAALVEEQVHRALLTKMRPLSGQMHKRLFDGYGPLSSFSGKIDVAYALHIITKATYRDLTTIRRIRNKFAHPMSPDTHFDSPEIRALFKQFNTFDDATTDYRAYYLLKLTEVDAPLEHVIQSSTSTIVSDVPSKSEEQHQE